VRPGREVDGSSAVSSAVSSAAGCSVLVSSSDAELVGRRDDAVRRRDVPVALRAPLSCVALGLPKLPTPVPVGVGRTSKVTPALCPHTKCETVPPDTLLSIVMQFGADAAVQARPKASLAHAGLLAHELIEAEAMHVVNMAHSSMTVPVQQPNQLLEG
jgi:hypothetical protein